MGQNLSKSVTKQAWTSDIVRMTDTGMKPVVSIGVVNGTPERIFSKLWWKNSHKEKEHIYCQKGSRHGREQHPLVPQMHATKDLWPASQPALLQSWAELSTQACYAIPPKPPSSNWQKFTHCLPALQVFENIPYKRGMWIAKPWP